MVHKQGCIWQVFNFLGNGSDAVALTRLLALGAGLVCDLAVSSWCDSLDEAQLTGISRKRNKSSVLQYGSHSLLVRRLSKE
jgi:hypothetical protein